MSQRVDIVCDRCGAVIKGETSKGAGPHWSVSFHSYGRAVPSRQEDGKDWFAFDSASWDVCADCVRVVTAALVATGLKPDKDFSDPVREMLGLATPDTGEPL